MKQRRDGIYCRYIKRLLDIVFALAVMIICCWLYGIMAILVRIKLGSPVIFKQPRPGKNEKIFTLYKFRTMTDAKDANGKLLPDEERLTRFGKALRSTSLDELPEAWNILKGDMSVVGPRPLLISYLPYYTARERNRHDLRPGLTGLAQIRGRNMLKWDERLETDVLYVESVSLPVDCKIVLSTIVKVIMRENIESSGWHSFRNLDEERKTTDDKNH